jgi:SAM-dependent methyltransferase
MASSTDASASPGAPPTADQILVQLLTGMWAMQSVATAARLGFFDALGEMPRTPEDVAASASADAGATARLLRAVASLGLLERGADGRYALTDVGQRLRTGVPGTFRDAFVAEADPVHWKSWEHLADAVRTGKPRPAEVFGAPAFEWYGKNPQHGEQFGRAMQNISRFAAAAVLGAYDFSDERTILDVGGGNGSMALAILEKHSAMKARVVDLPYIADAANAGIRAAGAAARCAFEPGDFFESVPRGADLQVLKFILHDWTDEECVRILANCREALEPGGRVLIVEMLVPPEIRPDFVMLMDLNMLVVTGGRERTEEEFGRILSQAGFRLARVIPTMSPFFLLEARPA